MNHLLRTYPFHLFIRGNRFGEGFAFYRDVPSILISAKTRPPSPLLLGTASRTSAPDLAVTLLKMLHLPPAPPPASSGAHPNSKSSLSANSKRSYDVFDYMQIFPGDKKTHFTKLQKQSKVDYEDMLFFDDERRNRNVEALGVTFWLVEDGVTRATVDSGIWEWRRRRGHNASKSGKQAEKEAPEVERDV